jgi:hypothetical protein
MTNRSTFKAQVAFFAVITVVFAFTVGFVWSEFNQAHGGTDIETDHLVTTTFDLSAGYHGAIDEVVPVGELDTDLFPGWACDVRAYLDNDSKWKGTDLLVGPLEASDVEMVSGTGILVSLGTLTGGETFPVSVRLGTGETGSGTFPNGEGQSATSLAGEVVADCVPPEVPPEPPKVTTPPPPVAAPPVQVPARFTG